MWCRWLLWWGLVIISSALQDQIGTLSDAAASTADKEAALAELQVLVEPIDNANGEGVHLPTQILQTQSTALY